MADSERIEFSRTLYEPEAVQAAVDAYGHLAKLELSTENDSIVVQVRDPDERVADRLVDALCNHALYETVARVRSSEEVA